MGHISRKQTLVVDDDALIQNGIVQHRAFADGAVLIDDAVFDHGAFLDVYASEDDRVAHGALDNAAGSDD